MQDVTWATRFNSFTRVDDGNDESESISIKDTGCEANSGPLSESFETKEDMMEKNGSLRGSLDELNEKMIEFATMNQKKFEHLDNKITIVEKDLVDLKEVLEEENIESLKVEMKNNSQIQKDCIKSNLSIKNEISVVKEQLYMVYGREFFNRRK